MPKRLSVFTGESSVVWAAPLNAEFDNVYTVFDDQIDGINTEIDNINDELTDFYSGTITRTGGSFNSNTDVEVGFGTGAPAHIVFSDANDCLAICLDTTIRRLLICEKGDETTNFGYSSGLHPNIIIHSSDATVAAQYMGLLHDGTGGYIFTGTGIIGLQPAGTPCSSFYPAGMVMESGTKIQLSNTSVAHGMTAFVPANVYADIEVIGADGGVYIWGFSEATNSLYLGGFSTTVDTTKSTAAIGATVLVVGKQSGTSVGSMGANANSVVIRNVASTTHIFDAEGDSHQDVGTTWTTFDSEDDIQLLTDLTVHVSQLDDPIKTRFQDFIKYNRETLERLKLVTFNDDGHHFVNMSKLTMLLVGAMRQMGDRIQGLERRLLEVQSAE